MTPSDLIIQQLNRALRAESAAVARHVATNPDGTPVEHAEDGPDRDGPIDGPPDGPAPRVKTAEEP